MALGDQSRVHVAAAPHPQRCRARHPPPLHGTHGVDIALVQAIAQLLDARRDLVKVDLLADARALDDVHPGATVTDCGNAGTSGCSGRAGVEPDNERGGVSAGRGMRGGRAIPARRRRRYGKAATHGARWRRPAAAAHEPPTHQPGLTEPERVARCQRQSCGAGGRGVVVWGGREGLCQLAALLAPGRRHPTRRARHRRGCRARTARLGPSTTRRPAASPRGGRAGASGAQPGRQGQPTARRQCGGRPARARSTPPVAGGQVMSGGTSHHPGPPQPCAHARCAHGGAVRGPGTPTAAAPPLPPPPTRHAPNGDGSRPGAENSGSSTGDESNNDLTSAGRARAGVSRVGSGSARGRPWATLGRHSARQSRCAADYCGPCDVGDIQKCHRHHDHGQEGRMCERACPQAAPSTAHWLTGAAVHAHDRSAL